MRYSIYANGDVVGSSGIGISCDSCKYHNRDGCIHCHRIDGSKKKSYRITNSDYRRIVSASINLSGIHKYNLLFITFTFPFEVTELQANNIIKKFFKNGVRNYKFGEYIWTKERQTLNHDRLHFHGLVDQPFVPILRLQDEYNCIISDVTGIRPNNRNSLRLPPDNHNMGNMETLQVAKYIAKYISKERGKVFEQPCFAISKGLYPVRLSITMDDIGKLIAERGIYKAFGNNFYSITQLKNLRNDKKKS